jgi:hypothetical protein
MGWIERVGIPGQVLIPEIHDVCTGQPVPVDPWAITLGEHSRWQRKDEHEHTQNPPCLKAA